MDGNLLETDGSAKKSPRPDSRRMVSSTLLGRHTHTTSSGGAAHIWQRGGTYLARGHHDGKAFGVTLGDDEDAAEQELRKILYQFDQGAFVRPSESIQLPLATGRPRLSLRELANQFLSEKRRTKGRQTAQNYRTRLQHVLAFAENPINLRRWPLAQDIDREFAIELRAALHQVFTTRNGRAGGPKKPLSQAQIINAVDTLRNLLHWARQPSINKLPAQWSNPLTRDIVGTRPEKDPLRTVALPFESRIRLINTMNARQLCRLAISMILPLRPEEVCGLLLSDVDLSKSWVEVGTRFSGGDHSKGRTSFKVPYPAELMPILVQCIGDRNEGPLLCSPAATPSQLQQPKSRDEIQRLFNARLATIEPSEVQNENDRKAVFRALLQDLGGLSPKQLGREFKRLARSIGITACLKDARHGVATAMERSGMDLLHLRYLTSHSTNDIMNAYVVLDPTSAMQKYFATIKPLLSALSKRAEALGISPAARAEAGVADRQLPDRGRWVQCAALADTEEDCMLVHMSWCTRKEPRRV